MRPFFASLLLLGASGLEPLSGHPGGVQHVVFSPDGSRLAAGGSASVVTVWDVATRKVVHALRGEGNEGALAFSPDGRFLTSGSSDGRVRVWNLTNGSLDVRFDHSPRRDYVYAVAYTPDGTRVASGGGAGSVIRLWDPAGKRLDRSFGTYGSAIFCLAFTPDGRKLLAGSEDGRLRAIDVANGLSTFDVAAHAGGTRSLAVSPDGKTVASGGVDKVARLWTLDDGKLTERRVLRGHRETILEVVFSGDGKVVATAAPEGTVRTWDTARGRAGGIPFRGRAGVRSAAFGPRGTLAVGLWTSGTPDANVFLGGEGVATVDHD